MTEKPKVNSKSQQEIDRLGAQFDDFQAQVKSLTVDEISKAPLEDFEPQIKVSNREVASMNLRYIKPSKTIGSREPFNEKFRASYEQAKKHVTCIVENFEVQGEQAEFWTKPYPGMPAEFWQLPVNVPIAVPGYVAQQASECKYHRLVMEDRPVHAEGGAVFTGAMAVSETKRRIDARPVGRAFVSMGS